MQHNIVESLEIPKFLFAFYQEAAISPADLLRNYALNHILSKIHKYEAEDNHFRKKIPVILKISRLKLRVCTMKKILNGKMI